VLASRRTLCAARGVRALSTIPRAATATFDYFELRRGKVRAPAVSVSPRWSCPRRPTPRVRVVARCLHRAAVTPARYVYPASMRECVRSRACLGCWSMAVVALATCAACLSATLARAFVSGRGTTPRTRCEVGWLHVPRRVRACVAPGWWGHARPPPAASLRCHCTFGIASHCHGCPHLCMHVWLFARVLVACARRTGL
jgi:hypothetical protein